MYGVIDIGSNTMRLSVYKKTENSIKLMFYEKNMAGLASYVDKENNLSEKGIVKAVGVLHSFKKILESIETVDVFVFATAALRNINNSQEAIDVINEATGYRIELISGEQEAIYDFIGTTLFMDLQDGIMVDIGGGSTELVFYRDKKVEKAVSLPIGSLNLYTKYVKDVFPTKKEITKIKSEVKDELKQIEIFGSYPVICGVGGSIRAVRKLNNDIYNVQLPNRTIEVKNLKDITFKFLESRLFALEKIIKLIPERIHTIIPGMLILMVIARYYQSDSIIVSKHGNREGYLYTKLFSEDGYVNKSNPE